MGRRQLAALAGVLAGAVTVGVGELIAALVRPSAAPIVAVGERLVTLTPEPVRLWAIRTFGTSDKTALLGGVWVVLALAAGAVGVLMSWRRSAGLAGVAVLGLLGCASAATAPKASAADLLPTLLGIAAGTAVLMALIRRIPAAVGRTGAVSRRGFLLTGIGAAVLALVSGLAGRAAQAARFDVQARRGHIRLPPPASPADPPPASPGPAATFAGTPWATPPPGFYRIDTELSVPQVDPDRWSLRIHGMVDRELTLSYPQLLRRPLIERWITLCCVSNPVGGPLIGNTRWLGARLAPLLREAGIAASADELLMTSVDGFTIGAPLAAVLDGRDALVAVGMGGEPLPVEHGFPARIVIPGLYGYVSACKWVTDLQVTTFAADQAFWIDQGWAQTSQIRLESRIDVPRPGATVRVGRATPIAGVAWDQHVGVTKVEVQVDGRGWRRAELGPDVSTDTWRQWYLPWTPEGPGRHVLKVRAFDGAGRPQDPTRRDPFPAGATGLHTVAVGAR